MVICLCHAVRDQQLRDAAASGISSFEDLQNCTRVSTGCGRCEPTARERFALALEPCIPARQPA